MHICIQVRALRRKILVTASAYCACQSVMYEHVSSEETRDFQSIDSSGFFFDLTCAENALTKVVNPIISSVFASDSIPTQHLATCHKS